MRVESNNSYATMSQGYSASKRAAALHPQDNVFQDSMVDESMRLKDVVYHDFSEFNPMNFLGTAYIRSKVMGSSYGQENSINLTPGERISLGKYSGENLYLEVRDSSCNIAWGSTPVGDDYNRRITDVINKMIGGAVDENGFPDMTKLTKEQNEIIHRMEMTHQWAVTQLGGPAEYDHLCRISDAIDQLIRIANGQMPKAALDPILHENIKDGLDRMGVDTSKPFYVNGRKFYFTEGGALRFFE